LFFYPYIHTYIIGHQDFETEYEVRAYHRLAALFSSAPRSRPSLEHQHPLDLTSTKPTLPPSRPRPLSPRRQIPRLRYRALAFGSVAAGGSRNFYLQEAFSLPYFLSSTKPSTSRATLSVPRGRLTRNNHGAERTHAGRHVQQRQVSAPATM
jgi:hypothetical protein